MSSCTYRIDFIHNDGAILEGPTYRASTTSMTCVKFMALVLEDLKLRVEYQEFRKLLMSAALYPNNPSSKLNFSCKYNNSIAIRHLSCSSD